MMLKNTRAISNVMGISRSKSQKMLFTDHWKEYIVAMVSSSVISWSFAAHVRDRLL